MPEKQSYICTFCAKSHHGKRRPRGWELTPEERLICNRCLTDRYETKAVTLPVRKPTGCDWKELRRQVQVAMRAARRVSNLVVQRLLAADAVRAPDDDKMPPMPQIYLYPVAREAAPELSPRSVTAIIKRVEQSYRARRYEMIWTGQSSAPSFRYPQPVPQTRPTWSVAETTDGLLASFQLLEGDSRLHALLTVRRGYGRRMHARIRALTEGRAIKSEAAVLYREAMRDGKRVRELCVKMVARFPLRTPKSERHNHRSGTLHVVTGRDCLWLAQTAAEERPRRWNSDEMREKVLAYRRALDRARQDGATQSNRMRQRRLKHRNRCRSFVEQMAADLCRHAERRNVATVSYDDAEHTWLTDAFVWSDLREQLRQKLAGCGIELVASGDVGRKTPAPLAMQHQESVT